MQVNEYPLAVNATQMVINVMDLYFLNKTYNDSMTQHDLQYAVMTLKGLLSNFEVITQSQVLHGLKYVEKSIFAHTAVVYTYDSEFYEDFFDMMGRVISKVYFDNEVYEQEIFPILRHCVDEFTRVLLLKMNPVTFTDYQYPFDKATYDPDLVQDSCIEVKLQQVMSKDLLSSQKKGDQI